ncbi:group II truncated hemoglobin [Flocculibacter collagenilyticus]|uniref:group II truncated hemoglobin n=1 Tax=Flocculibacter collagenilyticus TaxID=2744479 RepID=UPI0018F39AC1|nr:group II truncated hemoglobin [Flocculibacter collagenilyticus]
MIKKLSQLLTPKKPRDTNARQPIDELLKAPYDAIGGEAATRAIANRFYDIMASDPFAKELYAMHPQPLDRIRQVFFEFLSGWLGGPALFEEKYGHPRLRQRHMPFKITPQLRDQWLHCMNKTLDIEIDTPLLRAKLKQSLAQLATHMINSD